MIRWFKYITTVPILEVHIVPLRLMNIVAGIIHVAYRLAGVISDTRILADLS